LFLIPLQKVGQAGAREEVPIKVGVTIQKVVSSGAVRSESEVIQSGMENMLTLIIEHGRINQNLTIGVRKAM